MVCNSFHLKLSFEYSVLKIPEILSKIPLNGENSNTRDLAQIVVYLGNGLLVSQFYRMLHQGIKILVILLFIVF